MAVLPKEKQTSKQLCTNLEESNARSAARAKPNATPVPFVIIHRR